MSKLSHAHPQVLEIGTTIAEVVAIPGQGSRIRLGDDLFRHACGGQPADRGWLTWCGGNCRIDDVTRRDGHSWLTSSAGPEAIEGLAVVATIDAGRRMLLSRYHSLTHVLMGCLRRNLPGFISRGADIDGDAHTATLRFAATAFAADRIDAAVTEARAAISRGARVEVLKVKSLELAAARFPHFRIDPELALSGRIRLVDIAGIDSNPCSGSHVGDIVEIGGFIANHPVERGGAINLMVRLVVENEL